MLRKEKRNGSSPLPLRAIDNEVPIVFIQKRVVQVCLLMRMLREVKCEPKVSNDVRTLHFNFQFHSIAHPINLPQLSGLLRVQINNAGKFEVQIGIDGLGANVSHASASNEEDAGLSTGVAQELVRGRGERHDEETEVFRLLR